MCSGLLFGTNPVILEKLNSAKPWLVINEDLKLLFSNIHQKVFFLKNQTLSESYKFKNLEFKRKLGVLLNQTLKWSVKERNFYKRRGDFGNITLFGMTLPWSFETVLASKWNEKAMKSTLVPETYEVRLLFHFEIFKNILQNHNLIACISAFKNYG